MPVLTVNRLRTAIACCALVLCGCSSSTADTAASSTTTVPTTTTTAPPVVLALVPNLDLVESECFAEIPPPTNVPTPPTTLDGATTSRNDQASTGTEATVPDTLPLTTTIPKPPTIAVVDCNGSMTGQVYATFCLGDSEDSPGELTAVACPGDDGLDYPGDRTLRRAAARICLQRFEQTFREPYAWSTRGAQEFIPTEGVWNRGDRRAVCLATQPAPPSTTTSSPATG